MSRVYEPLNPTEAHGLQPWVSHEDDIEEINVYSPMDNGLYDENCFTKAAQKAILRSPNAIRKTKEIYNKENKA